MRSRIQKWGNSLALRIPKSFAAEAGLQKESPVDVSLTNGKLVITPVSQPKVTLEELVARISEENRHDEVDTGPARGNELW